MEERGSLMKGFFVFFIVLLPVLLFAKSIMEYMTEAIKESAPSLTQFVSENPLFSIIIISIAFTTFNTLSYKFLTSKETTDKIKQLKEEQKELQRKVKEEKDHEKMLALQKEMMEKSMKSLSLSMSHLFSPKFILLTTAPFIYLLWFLVGPLYYAAEVGFIIKLNLPFIGPVGGWLFCIILFTFILSIPLRKIFKVKM